MVNALLCTLQLQPSIYCIHSFIGNVIVCAWRPWFSVCNFVNDKVLWGKVVCHFPSHRASVSNTAIPVFKPGPCVLPVSQLSPISTFCHAAKHSIKHCMEKCWKQIRVWTHNRHPTPHPYGWSVGCLLWVFWRKITSQDADHMHHNYDDTFIL